MEINEAWTDIYDEGYIHQFQPEFTHKNSAAAAAPWSISRMIIKNIPILPRIVISCAMKKGIPF